MIVGLPAQYDSGHAKAAVRRAFNAGHFPEPGWAGLEKDSQRGASTGSLIPREPATTADPHPFSRAGSTPLGMPPIIIALGGSRAVDAQHADSWVYETLNASRGALVEIGVQFLVAICLSIGSRQPVGRSNNEAVDRFGPAVRTGFKFGMRSRSSCAPNPNGGQLRICGSPCEYADAISGGGTDLAGLVRPSCAVPSAGTT